MVRLSTLTIVLVLCGCSHHQLRFNTVKQAKTVADVHTQQALDNLAKFVQNPDALPHFSFPNAGSSSVNDSYRGNTGFNFNPFGLTSWSLGADGSRGWTESYTMTAISDPRKLELMRCAYQRAVSTCCGCGESGHCPDCEKRFNKFYLGTETPQKITETFDGKPVYLAKLQAADDGASTTQVKVYQDRDEKNNAIYRLLEGADAGAVVTLEKEKFLTDTGTGETRPAPKEGELVEPPSKESSNAVAKDGELPWYVQRKELKERLYVDGTVAEHTVRTGQITSDCLWGPCWFQVGGKHDVPLEAKVSGLVGHYNGTYVWVPDYGRDQLTKLTLAILDIAINDPPKAAPGRTKEVVVYLDKNENLANKSTAAYQITAVIPISDSHNTLSLSNKEKAAARFRKENLVRAEAQLQEAKANLGAANVELGELLKDQDVKALVEALNLSAKPEAWSPADFNRNLPTIPVPPNPALDAKLKQLSGINDRLSTSSAELRAAESTLRAIQLDQASGQRPEPIQMLPPTTTPIPGAGYLQFDQNLRALTPP